MAGRTTERTRTLRKRLLDPGETKLVNDVETYGCHIIQVREGNGYPGWSYTIGLSDVLGVPELIVIGLKEELALFLLNECSRRLQEGVRLEDRGRQRELLGNVDCEFRRVETKWLKQTMGYAEWFYDGDGFEVLQCVYPDLENRFPWDEEFDTSWRDRQPLLFPHSLGSRVEEDFWATNDPNSSLSDWKFKEPPHTGVFTTKRVMSGEDPITRVFHDVDDEAWQFHGPEESKPEDMAYVCLHHIVDKDPTIKELIDLPVGWCAWREKATGAWNRDVTSADADGDIPN